MSDSTPIPAGTLQIGSWRLDASSHRLSRDGLEKRLTRLQAQLLLALAERPGQSWPRQELITRVWPRRMVADEVLSRAVAQLRILLEDDARQPSYIETLHGTGYRLLAEVRQLSAATGRPAEDIAPLTARPDSSPSRVSARMPYVLGLCLAAICVMWVAHIVLQPSPSGHPADWPQRIAAAQSYMSTGDTLLQPRFSPDGRSLLWIEPGQRRLQIGDRGGRILHPIELAPAKIGSAAFSPDGQSVYALLQHEGCRLVEIPLPPRADPIDVSTCLHASLGLTVDGKGDLLFTGSHRGLLRHPRDGSPEQVLTSPDCETCIDHQPRIAGTDIVFLRGRHGQHAVVLRQPDGSEAALSEGDDLITDLVFDPERAVLLTASNAYGSPALVEIDPPTRNSRRLGGRGAYGLDIATDGALVFEQRRVQSPLWLRTADAGLRQLTQSLRDDSQAALSPDGRRIAFVSNRSGSGSIWLLDLDSGEESALSLPPARAWTRPSWSPDGGRLWLCRYDASGVLAVQVDVTTGSARPLPPELSGQAAERVIEVAQGEWLLIHARDGARVLALQRGPTHIEVAGSRDISSVAAEGHWVVFGRQGHPQLWAWRRDQPDRTAEALPLPSSSAWTLHQDAVWQYSPDAQGRLLRTSLVDGDTHVWADDFGSAPRDLLVTKGGDAVLFSRALRVDSELMLAIPQD